MLSITEIEQINQKLNPELAPRPQICLIGGNGFCAVAGEDESNRGAGI